MRSSTTAIPQPNRHSADTPRGLLARIRRAFGLEAPSREEIRRRIRSKPGIIDSLSPEALEYFRNYDGPEHLGPVLAEPKRGVFVRLRNWILDIDDLTPEEARRRIRSHPGYLETLSPEALSYMRNYDGPENMGPPLTKRERRQLAERLSDK